MSITVYLIVACVCVVGSTLAFGILVPLVRLTLALQNIQGTTLGLTACPTSPLLGWTLGTTSHRAHIIQSNGMIAEQCARPNTLAIWELPKCGPGDRKQPWERAAVSLFEGNTADGRSGSSAWFRLRGAYLLALPAVCMTFALHVQLVRRLKFGHVGLLQGQGHDGPEEVILHRRPSISSIARRDGSMCLKASITATQLQACPHKTATCEGNTGEGKARKGEERCQINSRLRWATSNPAHHPSCRWNSSHNSPEMEGECRTAHEMRCKGVCPVCFCGRNMSTKTDRKRMTTHDGPMRGRACPEASSALDGLQR